MSTEQWRPVVGFEGRYEVSDQGRVRSLLHSVTWVIRAHVNGSKYRSVHLRRDGRTHSLMVHALVAAAFHGPRPDGMQIRHLDGDALNNHASNLRYGTASENVLDAVRHGTHNQASKTHCPAGHNYAETARAVATGGRVCRACVRDNTRKYKARLRATTHEPDLEPAR